MKEKGYEVEHGGQLVTVFSAPNYCDQMGTQGALIRFKADAKGDLSHEYISFSHVPHPEVRAMQYANRALFGPMFGGA
jgi:serine/threonine-protein phosphatase 5